MLFIVVYFIFSKMIIKRPVLVYWQIEFLFQDIELWMIILVQIWQCPPISTTSLYRMWGGFQAKRQWFVRNPCIDIKIRIIQWNHFSRQVLPTFYQIQLIDKPNMFCIILNGKWKWAYFLNVKKSRGGGEGGQLNLKCFLRLLYIFTFTNVFAYIEPCFNKIFGSTW